MKNFLPIGFLDDSVQALDAKRRTKTRIIYTVVVCAVLCFLCSLPFIYIDVSIQSRGFVNSSQRNNLIQSAINAKIEQIYILENRSVKATDTLIILNTDEIDVQLNRLYKRIEENHIFTSDLTYLIRDMKHIQSSKYLFESLQFESRIKEINEQNQQLESEYNVSKTLFKQGVEAKLEFENKKSRYITALHQKETIINQFKNAWQAEISRLNIENKELNSQINQLKKRKDQYVITAPIDGKIIGDVGFQKGNFIQPGQTLAQISSADSLIIECYISPSDIGYIYKNQKTKIQIDTYNYQQWGLLEAYVYEITPDIMDLNGSPFFKIKCLASENYLTLPNGYKGSLKKGMSVTARIILTKRSLAQLLFDQMNNWMNPKIIEYGN
ncbi:MAG: HlyD family secretion protein [Bacteroidales bacterium]